MSRTASGSVYIGKACSAAPSVPKKFTSAPSAEDEVVVLERLQVVEADPARVEVDRGHGGLVHPRVLLAVQQVAQRVADRRRLEEAGRELVEQRLEGVVVVPVDEDDIRVGVLELLGRADTGEAAAENHDASFSIPWHPRVALPPPAAPRYDRSLRACLTPSA